MPQRDPGYNHEYSLRCCLSNSLGLKIECNNKKCIRNLNATIVLTIVNFSIINSVTCSIFVMHFHTTIQSVILQYKTLLELVLHSALNIFSNIQIQLHLLDNWSINTRLVNMVKQRLGRSQLHAGDCG